MSQFTIYNSSDVSAPVLNGDTGSLINVLNGCLVTGYGSKTPPSPAWTHPMPTTGSMATYRQGTGSFFNLVVNDNGPNATSTGKEAWATGWEVLTSMGDSGGTGSGQFPTAAQLLTTGHTVIRKSVQTGSLTSRTWTVFADSSTFYLFALTGDVASTYYAFGFGDFYSLNTATDLYRCMIIGRSAENSSAAGSEGMDSTNGVGNSIPGHFIARTYGGGGGSITAGKHGDLAKSQATGSLMGIIPVPNATDSAYYLSPVWICENAGPVIRGRLRGFYHLPHLVSGFTDGQTFSGSGTYNGKAFQILKTTPNSGMYCIETSDTLETN